MFWFIHIMAFVFFIPALLVTIPLHIISKKLDKQKAQPVESSPEPQEVAEQEGEQFNFMDGLKLAAWCVIITIWIMNNQELILELIGNIL